MWSRPPEKVNPEEGQPWDVDLFMSTTTPPAPAVDDSVLQTPEMAAEPELADLEPLLSPSPAANKASTVAADASQAANFSAPVYDMSHFNLPSGGASIGAVAIPVMAGGGAVPGSLPGEGGTGGRAGGVPMLATGHELSPIVRIPPAYPLEARRKKIEGWVRLEFTVQDDGSVANTKVKAAEPSGVFEQAAIAAIAQWKFTPAMENGKVVRRRVAQTLKFELNG